MEAVREGPNETHTYHVLPLSLRHLDPAQVITKESIPLNFLIFFLKQEVGTW